jgi:two-component system, chemotaxis family, protein-glutamate methylesterase/glutaminase
MIRVLVVEDSPVVRDLLVYILQSDPGIRVAATAGDGCRAIELALKERPDVITMDVHMPRLDGIEAVRRIMSTHPIPTVIISASLDPGEAGDSFRALEAGAIAICEKPLGITHPQYQVQARKIIQTVKMVSEVRMVRRWKPSGADVFSPPQAVYDWPAGSPRIECVAIGASTGGPPVLREILAGLSVPFPVPVLIVQHITPGFLPGLVGWLSSATGVPVEIACEGTTARPGHAYIAPDGAQMEVQRPCCIRLAGDPPLNGMCPSVSALFRSAADAFGPAAAGVLLTGMGQDGAEELLMMRKKGALTIAQDRESSVIHGMPGEAIRLGAARCILPPGKIVDLLNKYAQGMR